MAQSFIALYRGINVGGKNAVKMETLRGIHERLGHKSVRSYVQSGNVVFAAAGSAVSVESVLTAAFAKEYGFISQVLVIEAELLRTVAEENPYESIGTNEPTTVHVGFCKNPPSATGLEALLAKSDAGETFVIEGRVIYLHAPSGIGRSKFAAGMERASGVAITLRIWRTIRRLAELADSAQ